MLRKVEGMAAGNNVECLDMIELSADRSRNVVDRTLGHSSGCMAASVGPVENGTVSSWSSNLFQVSLASL